MIYLQLLYSYLKIGFFGFGGGYAMLALIHNEIVVRHHWLTNSELTDIIAISQMTPGPIAINRATLSLIHIYYGFENVSLGHSRLRTETAAVTTVADVAFINESTLNN